jgi:hypothetical protein
MQGRRVIIVVAIVMGLMALAASVAPPPQRTPDNEPSPTPTAPAAGAIEAQQVTARLDADRSSRARVRAREGDTVVLEVSGDVVDSVEIPDLDVVEPIDPGSPAQIEIYVDTPGDYPIRLLDSGRMLGVLQVSRAS